MDTRRTWRQESFAGLAEAIGRGPDAPVAAYPTWAVRDLAVHVLRILGNATLAVRSGVLERPSPTLGASRDDAAEVLTEALRIAVADAEDALAGSGHARVWTPVGARPPLFWERRLLREAVLHRWDAEHAQGRPSPVGTDRALDLVDEFVDTDARRAVDEGWRAPAPVVLDAGARRWRIDPAGGVSAAGDDAGGAGGAGEGGVARISGDAATLWLWLMRREDLPGAVDVDDVGGAAGAFHDLVDGLKRPSR
ncbi:MAG: maleylpyruvate isomerase N-terminal domain-containing protein [Actinomycetota bacterium]